MEHAPIFLRLAGRRCLVVGAGEVALRKVEWLLRAHARVFVVAPDAHPELVELAETDAVEWARRGYASGDLEGVHVVIAATDSREVNATISREAQAHRIPVNVVDDPELCSFIVPAIVDRGPVVVAVSTGGASPALAGLLRRRIEEAIPEGAGKLAELLRGQREALKEHLPDIAARKAFWERVVGGEVTGLAFSGRIDQAKQTLDTLIARLRP